MSRRLKVISVVVIALIVMAQLIRPNRANPATDASRTIAAHAGTPSGLASVLDRSCRDCHSNATVWPAAAQVAPLSWLMAYAVKNGRKAVNFSEWAGYSPDEQLGLLATSCQDATAGKMPGAYTWVRPETRLSEKDVATICSAARQPAADATDHSQHQQ